MVLISHACNSVSAPRSSVIELIANPDAGSYSRSRLTSLTRAFEDCGATVLVKIGSIDREFAFDPRATHIVSYGGDGTARLVANALRDCGRDLPMSIYPAGTVNLIARELGHSRQPRAFAHAVTAPTTPHLHYRGSANDRDFMACASVGPDSLAISHLSLALKRRIGRLAYGVALARLLLTWERPAIRLEINGKTIACEAFYVAKGRFFAGGWSFAPTMRLTTPEFEVITLARADRLGYARFLWLLLRGLDAERQPGVERHRCTGFAAHSETPLPLQADGDIITHLPARLTISAPLRIH